MARLGLAMAVALALALALALAPPPPATGAELFTADDMESDDSMWALYQRWGARYNLERDDGEKTRRFAIFKETARLVYAAHPGDRHYTLGLNVFADRTADEVRDAYSCEMTVDGGERRGANVSAAQAATEAGEDQLGDLPDYVDWRTADCYGHRCVTKVKDQGNCGCCWAMAATGAIESLNAINGHTGDLVELSVQQIVDCDKRNNGCGGGFAYMAFQYVIHHSDGGLTTEAAYPYVASVGTCQAQADPDELRVPIVGFTRMNSLFDLHLMSAVSRVPVVVAIDASDPLFIHYAGGVYRGSCGHSLNHEMLLVGYGSTGTTVDDDDLHFWIVKNTASEGWGEGGYILIPRNSDPTEDTLGTCGILIDNVYPNMAD